MRTTSNGWDGSFWYTVEFGLMRQNGKIKVYGSGVISSHAECTNVIEGGCQVRDFNLDEILDTPVIIDQLQKILFAIESFDQVYEVVHEADRRIGERLDDCEGAGDRSEVNVQRGRSDVRRESFED